MDNNLYKILVSHPRMVDELVPGSSKKGFEIFIDIVSRLLLPIGINMKMNCLLRFLTIFYGSYRLNALVFERADCSE